MRRLFPALAAIALFGAACYSSEPAYRYSRRGEARVQAFDAYTTNGDFVRVDQDARSGQLIIMEPQSMRGAPVAMINNDGGNGFPTVAIDQRYGDRYRHGSGGDIPYHR